MEKCKKIISLLLAVVTVIGIVTAIPFTGAAAEVSGSSVRSGDPEMTVSGTNSLGNMLTGLYEEKEAENDEDEMPSAVYAVEVKGTKVRADVSAMNNALLVVALFDDEGDIMYGSGSTEITPDDRIVELTLEIDPMPQYFLVRAFMLDQDTNLPLCKAYESDEYTQKMQEFYAKTTEDFDPEKVLNLDEKTDNNFLVYADDTKVIRQTDENTNVVTKADYENKEFVIEQIDDSVSSLKPDDVFAYSYSEEGLLIVRVASIEINGTTAVIHGKNMELQEAFEYIRIEAAQNTDDAEVDNSELDENIDFSREEDPSLAPTGLVMIDEELSESRSLEYTFQEIKFGSDADGDGEKDNTFSGTVGLTLSLNLSVYWDAHLFDEDEFEFSLNFKYELEVSLKLALEFSTSAQLKNKPAFELSLLSYRPIPGVTIKFKPSIVLEGKIEVELKGTLYGQIGKKLENGKFKDDSKSPTFQTEFTVSGELFIGISLEPELEILEGVISASLEAKAGVKLTAEMKFFNYETGAEERHTCKECIAGELSFVFSVTLEVDVLDLDDLTWSVTPLEKSWKLCDCYYSIDHHEFGFSECPHIEYKVTFGVFDYTNQPVAGATVNGQKTGENGNVTLYLKPGRRVITLEKDDKMDILNVDITKPARMTISFDVTGIGGGSESGSGSSSISENAEKANVVKAIPDIDASGTCGKNLKWYLTGKGVLHITGSGPMDDYGRGADPPWLRKYENIKKVVVADGVTSIGKYAFDYCFNLREAEISDSVTKIDEDAFCFCQKLQSVKLGKSLKTIGENAFYSCEALESIDIPDSVTSIGARAFFCCEGLTSVNIGKSVTEIGKAAFLLCKNIDNIYFPNSVKTIDESAFAYCEKLDLIAFPDSLTYVGDDAFEDTAWYQQLPDGIVYTGHFAYRYKGDCPGKETIRDGTLGILDDAFSWCSGLTSITIPDSVKTIGNKAFYYCSNLTTARLGNSITHIGDDAFIGCSALTDVTMPDSVTTIGESAFAHCSSLASVKLSNSLTGIPEYAFDNCYNLPDIVIPHSVTFIGDWAFGFCRSFTSIEIPDSVTEIGEGAFYEDIYLQNILIPDSVESIGKDAFYFTQWLMDQPYGEIVYAGKVAYEFKGACPAEVTIRNGTKGISENAFSYCRELVSVTIPDSVKRINTLAFFECDNLKSVTIPASVTGIGDMAFGYYEDWGYQKIEGFTVCGVPGSAAEQYAIKNGFAFVWTSDKAATAYTAADEAQTTDTVPDKEPVDMADVSANEGADATDESYSCYDCIREHLIPGTEAVLVVLRSEEEMTLTPDNLLYIGQQTVSDDGTVSIPAFGNFDDGAVSLIIGSCDHAAAWQTVNQASDQHDGLDTCVCEYCHEVIDMMTPVILGDVDGDGEVTVIDATLIQRYLVDIPLPFLMNCRTADTHSDDEVTIMDASYLQRWLAKLDSNENIGKSI